MGWVVAYAKGKGPMAGGILPSPARLGLCLRLSGLTDNRQFSDSTEALGGGGHRRAWGVVGALGLMI